MVGNLLAQKAPSKANEQQVERGGVPRVAEALRHATRFGAFSYKAVLPQARWKLRRLLRAVGLPEQCDEFDR